LKEREMSNSQVNREAESVSYLKNADEENASLHPALWSYVIRDPAGLIALCGHGHTRKACELQALLYADTQADELEIVRAIVRYPRPVDGWEFVVCRPTGLSANGKLSRPFRPSITQIEVLMFGLIHKFSRCHLGWYYDEPSEPSFPVRICGVSTINSLWQHGLLHTNCPDPRASFHELVRMHKLNGASEFQVWTSDLGAETLQNEGWLLLRDPKPE
jgi:hypothetical protein